MDEFKQKMTKRCAVGGINCRCCNPFHKTDNKGKDKAKLNRIARRTLKQADRKENDKI